MVLRTGGSLHLGELRPLPVPEDAAGMLRSPLHLYGSVLYFLFFLLTFDSHRRRCRYDIESLENRNEEKAAGPVTIFMNSSSIRE